MHAADFELTMRLPADARFAETLRELAAHAARYAGGEQDAERYASAVRQVALACLDQSGPDAEVVVILRRGSGPLEFLIGCETAFEPGRGGRGIDVGWTQVQGATMCRVSMDVGSGLV